MIHYHGGPITPRTVALAAWARRHAMISFAYPEQLPDAAEVAQSFALDNGAFTAWKAGRTPNWDDYMGWVLRWRWHPGFDWAVIPDLIDGDEADNDGLLASFVERYKHHGRVTDLVPVWHLHESLNRLEALICQWHRIALGSSGEFSNPGSNRWWNRISRAMSIACTPDGCPRTKLHLLRGLDPTLLSHLPLSSADSTNAAKNHPLDTNWEGPYEPASQEMKALVLVDRIESHAVASRWVSPGIQDEFTFPMMMKNPKLIG